MNANKIRTKAILGLPLTEKERALFLLYIATENEAHAFVAAEKAALNRR